MEASTENFLKILANNEHFVDIKFNTLRGYPERVVNGKRIQWTDADDADARVFIEGQYGIFSRQKFADAFDVFVHQREYNPVQERILQTEWDGQKRCENFLSKWMGAVDTPYVRECSRLIFAGGINRAFRPGCKSDCVIVLVGSQGAGKSTLCRWLALEDDFFAGLKTISGQRGFEAVQGVWIAEIEELLAVIANDRSGTKVEENAKTFLSTQSDFYRRPYDRRPTFSPRTNIFLGTTNRATFLTDKTGNRRWFPVRCNMTAAELYRREKECKNDIQQCWAEMYAAFNTGNAFARACEKIELLDTIKSAQTDAEVDDYRVGLFEDYLAGKPKVCIIQLWDEVLFKGAQQPPQMTRKDAVEIAEILTNKLGWSRGNTSRFGAYGQQKSFLPPEDSRIIPFRDELPL